MIGVAGLTGHALPALALARELRARGHEVLVHTNRRFRSAVEGTGARFAEGGPLARPEPGARRADEARALIAGVESFEPDLVISDALTLSPALAAEAVDIPRAILFPQVYPGASRGLPFFSLGIGAPRTALGSAAWRLAGPLGTRLPSTAWLRGSRRALNAERAVLGLPAVEDFEGMIAPALTLVATFPQLEYPRSWPDRVSVTGPMWLDPPHPAIGLPSGDEPLVLVAPSTVKDPRAGLVETALRALSSERVRVVATLSGSRPAGGFAAAPNVVVADWVDYSQVMPEASLVICHGNHGTMVRALAEGVPVLVCPEVPDDAEHGARVAWAGAGLMIPRRLVAARSLRLAVRMLLADGRYAQSARSIARWSAGHDGPSRGADLVERHIADPGRSPGRP